MKTSPFLEEIAQAARVQSRKESLIDLIGARIGQTIPHDILSRIEAEEDFPRLKRWFTVIANVSSFDELRALFNT